MANRKTVGIRLTPLSLDWVDEVSTRHEVNRSTTLRAMLAVAARHSSQVDQQIDELKKAGAV